MPVVTSELKPLRDKIDAVDQQILKLLHDRVGLVIQVGDYKRARNIPVYDPERERALLDRLCKAAEHPLDADAIRRIFERLVDEFRRIEQHHVG